MSDRMSLEKLISGRQKRPLRISLYGVDGIGKSTWAAAAPAAIFLGAEDGTANLDTTRFPQPESWGDIMDAITTLFEHEHSFKTLILDSADWAEILAQRAVCEESQVNSIEKIDYGKGYVFVADKFKDMLRGFDALYQQRGMNIIVISHAKISKFNDPENEPYDRFSIKLNKHIEPLIREWCDMNLFANYDTSVKKVGKGFNEQTQAVSYGKRLVFSQRRAAFDAKTRYRIPERLPLDWDVFWAAYQDSMKPPAQDQQPQTDATKQGN
jgi:hypothetical protein